MTTPALTAEERAKRLAINIFASGHGWSPMSSEDATKLIATAIREAEDAAYERAAVAVMTTRRGMSCFLTTNDCQHFNMGVVASETAVLNLKSQEP